MAAEYNFKNEIVIGLPWSVSAVLPENLSGKTVQFLLRKNHAEDAVGTYVSPTNITIGTPGTTTPITITLTASDTGGMTPQEVAYSLRVVGSREYMYGKIPVKS